MLRIYSLIKFLGFDPVLFLNNIYLIEKLINKHEKSVKMPQNKHLYAIIEKRLNSNAMIV